jgi:hypothetical protein
MRSGVTHQTSQRQEKNSDDYVIENHRRGQPVDGIVRRAILDHAGDERGDREMQTPEQNEEAAAEAEDDQTDATWHERVSGGRAV